MDSVTVNERGEGVREHRHKHIHHLDLVTILTRLASAGLRVTCWTLRFLRAQCQPLLCDLKPTQTLMPSPLHMSPMTDFMVSFLCMFVKGKLPPSSTGTIFNFWTKRRCEPVSVWKQHVVCIYMHFLMMTSVVLDSHVVKSVLPTPWQNLSMHPRASVLHSARTKGTLTQTM